ncbi:MAG: hypothetical protein LQ338_004054, partial [Usnochroma carphineum]
APTEYNALVPVVSGTPLSATKQPSSFVDTPRYQTNEADCKTTFNWSTHSAYGHIAKLRDVKMKWADAPPDTKQNTCLPPKVSTSKIQAQPSTARSSAPALSASGQSRSFKIHSNNLDKQRSESYQKARRNPSHPGYEGAVDIVYATAVEIRSPSDRSRNENLSQLPTFHSTGVGVPPYLFVKIIADGAKMAEAIHRLALITACALNDRLQLRSGSATMEPHSFKADDSIAIYAVVASRELCQILKMSVRHGAEEDEKSQKPIKYVLGKVASIALDAGDGIQELWRWLNKIHYYGLTAYAPAAYVDAREYRAGRYNWKKGETTFCYGENNTLITKSKGVS